MVELVFGVYQLVFVVVFVVVFMVVSMIVFVIAFVVVSMIAFVVVFVVVFVMVFMVVFVKNVALVYCASPIGTLLRVPFSNGIVFPAPKSSPFTLIVRCVCSPSPVRFSLEYPPAFDSCMIQ